MISNHLVPDDAAPAPAYGIKLALVLDGGFTDGASKDLQHVDVAPDECVAVMVGGEPALFVHGDGTCELP